MKEPSNLLREKKWNIHMKVTCKILAVAGLNGGQKLEEACGWSAGLGDVLNILVAFMLHKPNPLTVMPKLGGGEVDVLLYSACHCPTALRERRHAFGPCNSMIATHRSDQEPTTW